MDRGLSVLILLLLAGFTAVACRADEASIDHDLQLTGLQINVPATVALAQPMTVEVAVNTAGDTSATGLPVTLLAQGTFGDYLAMAPVTEDGVDFVLGEELTAFAGAVTFVARAGSVEARGTSQIEPGPPADPIVTLVGPRSLEAATEATMFTTVVRDVLNNPVTDGTPVVIHYRHPSEQETPETATVTVSTEHLLAWARLPAGELAGPMRMAASAGAAHSAERDVLVVPGPPIGFDVAVEPTTLPADGRQLAELQTSLLLDRYGNVLLDGTSVTFLVEQNGALIRSLPAHVIDGKAFTLLQAPAEPATFQVRAVVADVSSAPTTVVFTPGPAVQPFPITATVKEQTVDFMAGPLVGDLRQFVPNGTLVNFYIVDALGHMIERSSPSEQGYARLTMRLADFAPGPVQVDAALGPATGSTSFRAP